MTVHPYWFLPPITIHKAVERRIIANDRDLVAFVLRNTPGANVDVDDIRTVQAAMAWWRKFGGDARFEAYLEPIPAAPNFAAIRRNYPHLNLPLLVDPRLGHVRTAELIGVQFRENGHMDGTLIPSDPRHTPPTDVPFWVLAHDGTPNLNRRPQDCLADCTDRFLAGTADILFAIWLQYGPRVHVMDGPGSVSKDYRGCAYLCPLYGSPYLSARRYRGAAPNYGSVFFVRG